MIVINGMIEMEQNESGSLAAVGDSCAETGRAMTLGAWRDHRFAFTPFITPTGFLRHPRCANVPAWDEADFSNDQLLPLMMVVSCDVGRFYIKGTKTLLSLGAQLLKFRMYRTLGLVNAVQSLLRPSPADTLNMAVIAVFLRSKGYWAPLAMSNAAVMANVEAYYKPEPNPWIVPYYRWHFPDGKVSLLK